MCIGGLIKENVMDEWWDDSPMYANSVDALAGMAAQCPELSESYVLYVQ